MSRKTTILLIGYVIVGAVAYLPVLLARNQERTNLDALFIIINIADVIFVLMPIIATLAIMMGKKIWRNIAWIVLALQWVAMIVSYVLLVQNGFLVEAWAMYPVQYTGQTLLPILAIFLLRSQQPFNQDRVLQ